MSKAYTIALFIFLAACGNPTEDNRKTNTGNNRDSFVQLPKDSLKTTAHTTDIDSVIVLPFSISNCTLTLSAEILKTLAAYDPQFKVWQFRDYAKSCVGTPDYQCTEKQTPFAVIGDFNGDTIPDITLMGHNATSDLTLALVSNKKGFRVVEITKTDLSDPSKELCGGYGNGLWIYLAHFPPRKIKSPYEEKELLLRNDAFEVIYCGKAATVYYYKNGRFITYATAD